MLIAVAVVPKSRGLLLDTMFIAQVVGLAGVPLIEGDFSAIGFVDEKAFNFSIVNTEPMGRTTEIEMVAVFNRVRGLHEIAAGLFAGDNCLIVSDFVVDGRITFVGYPGDVNFTRRRCSRG